MNYLSKLQVFKLEVSVHTVIEESCYHCATTAITAASEKLVTPSRRHQRVMMQVTVNEDVVNVLGS